MQVSLISARFPNKLKHEPWKDEQEFRSNDSLESLLGALISLEFNAINFYGIALSPCFSKSKIRALFTEFLKNIETVTT